MNYKFLVFAIIMQVVCLTTATWEQFPSDWAAQFALLVGSVGAIVFFYFVAQFFLEKCDEHGVVLKAPWKR